MTFCKPRPHPVVPLWVALALSLSSALASPPPAETATALTEIALRPEVTDSVDPQFARRWHWENLGTAMPAGAGFDPNAPSFDAWKVLSTRMDFALNHRQPAVDASLHEYRQQPSILEDAIPQAAFYLPYITERMMESNLPPELALLPFVESAYDPKAVSPNGASGLWQITRATADKLGLKRNQWYDGRNDLIRSTDAAIAYLSYLNRRFSGDWLLSLAAYNGGEGTVARALSASKASGGKADFWTLNLPTETRYFVPRFLALAQIFQDSDQMETLALHREKSPSTIEALLLPRRISLAQAAQLADIDYELIERLNTGLKQGITPPNGPHTLVVPSSAAQRLLAAIKASN